MTGNPSYGRLLAALAFAILLFVPILLAGLPMLPANAVFGPFVRSDAIVGFFAAVPVLFAAVAAYRVAQYYHLFGRSDGPR